jgi:RNA polymerase sigma-70 factor, ECF subfamily
MDAHTRFESLYRRHAADVSRYVHRRCDPSSADDAVADVFVVAWRRLEEIPDDALPWLLGVARRTLANRRRGDARAIALRDRIRAQPQPAPADAHAPGLDAEAVSQALAALPERDREVLLLVAWEGLSTARAARVLGIGANACAARLSRARKRLAGALGVEDRPTPLSPPAGREVLR